MISLDIFIYILIAIIFIGFVYGVYIYGRLKKFKQYVDDSWESVLVSIDELKTNILENIDNYGEDKKKIKVIIKKMVMDEGIQEFIAAYVNLDKLLGENALFEEESKSPKVAIRAYNDDVLKYNNEINMIFKMLVANVFGFKPGIYFRSKK